MNKKKMIKRKCLRCGCKIDKCMGFVLARDLIGDKKQPRELCGKCVLIIDFEELEKLAGVAQSERAPACQVGGSGIVTRLPLQPRKGMK